MPMMAQAWDGIIPGLQDGKYDAISDGMSITAKREEVIAFSRPYTNSPTGFTVQKDGPLAKMPGTGERVSLDDDAAARRLGTYRPRQRDEQYGPEQKPFHLLPFSVGPEPTTYR